MVITFNEINRDLTGVIYGKLRMNQTFMGYCLLNYSYSSQIELPPQNSIQVEYGGLGSGVYQLSTSTGISTSTGQVAEDSETQIYIQNPTYPGAKISIVGSNIDFRGDLVFTDSQNHTNLGRLDSESKIGRAMYYYFKERILDYISLGETAELTISLNE